MTPINLTSKYIFEKTDYPFVLGKGKANDYYYGGGDGFR